MNKAERECYEITLYRYKRRLSLHLGRLSGYRCGVATMCPRRGGPISHGFRPLGVR
jgi:hypothetical protein